MSPRPDRRHQLAAQCRSQQLDQQLPADWESVLDLEVVVRAEHPPIVRVPDVVVTQVGGPAAGGGCPARGRDRVAGFAKRRPPPQTL
ncbi:MAG: hypothetical protein M3Y73_22625 [Actinomycetota bacterium]|nr:hypothetical protein [Actinomycetota bacterium]